MKGFPFITATVCLLAGAIFHEDIKKFAESVPLLKELFKDKEETVTNA